MKYSELTEAIVRTQFFRKNLVNYLPPEFNYLDTNEVIDTFVSDGTADQRFTLLSTTDPETARNAIVKLNGEVVKRGQYDFQLDGLGHVVLHFFGVPDGLGHILPPSEGATVEVNYGGDLASFIKIFAITMDEIKDYIDAFTEVFDIRRCDPQYLPYIAAALGHFFNASERSNVLIETADETIKEEKHAFQRRQLENAVAAYKVKGALDAFRTIFYVLGYKIKLYELWTTIGYPLNEISDISARVAPWSNQNLTRSGSYDRKGTNFPSIFHDPDHHNGYAYLVDHVDDHHYQSDYGQSLPAPTRSGEDSISITLRRWPVLGVNYQVFSRYLPHYIGVEPDNVTPDNSELLENGGRWYKSSHFVLELESVSSPQLDVAGTSYLMAMIHRIRPAHTVLEYLQYAVSFIDTFSMPTEQLANGIGVGLYDHGWYSGYCTNDGTDYRRGGQDFPDTDLLQVTTALSQG